MSKLEIEPLNHQPFPEITPGALARFYRICEQTEGNSQGFFDAETGFLVSVSLDRGRITRWAVSGPMTLAEAQEMVGRTLKKCQQQAEPIH